MAIQIDKLKGPLMHKHKDYDNYEFWNIHAITKKESVGATLPSAAELLTNKPYPQYGVNGAQLYKNENGSYTKNLSVPVFDTNVIWKVSENGMTDGVFNRCAVWSATDSQIGQYIGFGREVDVPESKIYYIGVASDNGLTVEINSKVIFDLECNDLNEDTYKTWHILPVNLFQGVNIIHLTGKNDSGPAAFGAEVYNATLAQLQNVATVGELDALTIFSTKSLIGSYAEEGNLGIGYTCPSGYSLINRNGVFSCDKITYETVPVNSHDSVEFKVGDTPEFSVTIDPVDPTNKIITFPISETTSIDGSITVNGNDLSVKRPELELYASNEAELLAAWSRATARTGCVRIFITGSIIFTANRQFIWGYPLPSIKFEAITPIYFIAGSHVIDFGNIVFTNITFRTTGTYYFRVVGGVGTFNNCGWIDDVRDASLGDTPKKNIVIIDPVTANTGKIVLKGITHFTQSSGYNGSALIQPFWIENQASFGSSIYIENLEMSAVSEAARFARVLLTSTVADCPYKVTGDESWFFAPAQELPGVGNIAATAQILRVTTVDKFNAARLETDNSAPYHIGMKANGDAVKIENTTILDINFLDLTPLVYNVPASMKFTAQTSEGAAATLSIALNTNMAKYDKLTITPTQIGLVTLTGILL